jgi:hypothetical protein
MAHIHLIVHVMHELVPKSALIVLMGRHVNKAHIRNQTWKHMLLSPLTTITKQYANPGKGYKWWYIHNASQIYTWKTRYLLVANSTVSAITSIIEMWKLTSLDMWGGSCSQYAHYWLTPILTIHLYPKSLICTRLTGPNMKPQHGIGARSMPWVKHSVVSCNNIYEQEIMYWVKLGFR